MTSLDLRIYVRDDLGNHLHPDYGYCIPDDTVDDWAEEKHFTDAELAAEYLRAEHDWDASIYGFPGHDLGSWSGEFKNWNDIAEDRVDTLRRFATFPHARELDAAEGVA